MSMTDPVPEKIIGDMPQLAISLERLREIDSDPRLSDGDLRVLLSLMAKIESNNILALDISWLAERMGRDRAGISRAVKRLTEVGAISRRRGHAGGIIYELDPELAVPACPEG